MTLYFLQQYWWVLVSLLGAVLVFLMFVQGGQTLLYGIAKGEDEKQYLLSIYGHNGSSPLQLLLPLVAQLLPRSLFSIQQVSVGLTGFGFLYCFFLCCKLFRTNLENIKIICLVQKHTTCFFFLTGC